MGMPGPVIDDVEQMLRTQKMSACCHTAAAQCIYICCVYTVRPCAMLQNILSLMFAKCLQAIAHVWLYLNMPDQHLG